MRKVRSSHQVKWCLVVFVGDCSLPVNPYIRLGFGRFQYYLLSFKFKFISVKSTQTGYTSSHTTKAYPIKCVQLLCLRHHTKYDPNS